MGCVPLIVIWGGNHPVSPLVFGRVKGGIGMVNQSADNHMQRPVFRAGLIAVQRCNADADGEVTRCAGAVR